VIAYVILARGEVSEVVTHALGFSGVLLALIVIDIKLSGGDNRSVFGIFLVPAWTYPWVMLLLLSLLMPNVSVFGHISGLITGYLYKYHVLSFLAPSLSFFGRVERCLCPCFVNRLGYLAVDGIRDSGYLPFALFRRFFPEYLSDETPPPADGLRDATDEQEREMDHSVDELCLSDENRFV
jgi:hypothetical protein